MASTGRGRGTVLTCRVGLVLSVTAGLTAPFGMPYSAGLLLAGVALLVAGGAAVGRPRRETTKNGASSRRDRR